MVVQQHILNWLYSVLTSEYHDVNRTYNDVAQALSQYPSLSPQTDVHTSDNGTSALLLLLSGTIPVVFRGMTYRFPISIWVPHAYPRQAPMVYVTPTETMMIRPGQHVDPQGQVYHPYLAGWAEFWDKSTILDFLAVLRDVFAKEPPVIARPQGPSAAQPPRQSSQQQIVNTPPPVPPLPPELSSVPTSRPASRPASYVQSPPAALDARSPPPPPPPPKPNVQQASHPGIGPADPPPLPPLPPGAGHEGGRPASATSNRVSRYDAAPPLPPQGQPTRPAAAPAGGSPYQQHSHPQQYRQQAPPPPAQYPGQDMRRVSTMPLPKNTNQYPPAGPQPWQQPTQQAPYQQYPPQQYPSQGPPAALQTQVQQQQQQAPQPKAPPPPDIMDMPLTLSIPSPTHGGPGGLPAPPIPPNPEKDALLHQLAATLHAARVRSRAQDEASLAGLAAQRAAMLAAVGTMQAELSGLSQFTALLNSNTAALHDTIRRADAILSTGAGAGGEAQQQQHKQPPPPNIDDLLVAPTVVGGQLYELVAEERALADAIFVLGRAVERGRVAPHAFARNTRALAREWYLKKALARKIGRGMGLVA